MKYIFRGITVFEYDPKTRMVTAGIEDGIVNFNMCNFIPEDYKLLERFFKTCYKHTQLDKVVDLTDIVVD